MKKKRMDKLKKTKLCRILKMITRSLNLMESVEGSKGQGEESVDVVRMVGKVLASVFMWVLATDEE